MEGHRRQNRANSSSLFVAGFVFVLLAGVSIFLFFYTRSTSLHDAEVAFELAASDTATRVENRLGDYLDLLVNLRALFAASDDVRRDEFAAYVGSLEVNERLHGVQAIEFVSVVDGLERDDFIASV